MQSSTIPQHEAAVSGLQCAILNLLRSAFEHLFLNQPRITLVDSRRRGPQSSNSSKVCVFSRSNNAPIRIKISIKISTQNQLVKTKRVKFNVRVPACFLVVCRSPVIASESRPLVQSPRSHPKKIDRRPQKPRGR